MTSTVSKQPLAPLDDRISGAGRPRSGRIVAAGRAAPWLVPAGVLIFGVVLFPAAYLIYNSTRNIGPAGNDIGPAGLRNFATLFARPELLQVLLNTAIWVVGVVVVTVLISLGLAQLLNSYFPGRRIVRTVVLIPWAASVVMTTLVFVNGLNPFYGIINRFLVDAHVLKEPYGFLQNPLPAFIVAMVVAVFVSLPFTAYVILAGLSGIPEETIEAARVDGASPGRIYVSVVLPQLHGALILAVLINIINVFNNLPILQLLTGPLPGYSDDTTTTLMFKILQGESNVGESSALGVINLVIVFIVIAIYLALTRPMKEIDR